MIKICYVVTIPQTIEAFFIPQLKLLSENGFDVTVICSQADQLRSKLGEGIKTIAVDIPRGVSLLGTAKAVRKLKAAFKKERFDIIQYSTPNAAFCASIASKRVGCAVRNYHLMGFRYLGAVGIFKKLLKGIEKLTCRSSTSIECVSASNMQFGISEGLFAPDKATVIWHGSTGGVDTERFAFAKRAIWRSEVRSALGVGSEEFVYGFVGRITGDKGVNEILKAFGRLNGGGRLLMIGDFENRASIDAQLLEQAENDANIIFVPVVSDIERYYAAMDVLLLPSYREGFGNVIIEAASVGTPAIVSDIPGPTDAIQLNKTALTVPPGDAEALEKAMYDIVRMDHIGMGKAAAEYAANCFDSRTLCTKILERKKELAAMRH